MRKRRTSASIIGLGLAALALPASAGVVTSTWTGSVDDQWTTAGNWSNDDASVRSPADTGGDTFDVFIGAALVTYTSNINVSVSSISLTDASSTLNVDGPGSLIASTTTATGSVVVSAAGQFNAGAMTMASGNLQIQGTLTVSSSAIGAGIGGNGTIAGPLDSSNLLGPSGTLSVTQTLLLHDSDINDPKSVLRIAVDGTGSNDLLSVGGSAALAGFLDLISLPNGPGSVQQVDTFTILSASSISGVFENILNGQRLDALDGDDELAGSFRVNYGGSSNYGSNLVVLDDFQPVPEPGSAALLAVGGMAILTRRRRRIARI